MKKPKIALFLILTLTSFVVQAQTNFLKGYYVTSDQDTVHGYISYRSKAKLNKRFTYKANPGAVPVTLYPGSVSAFAIQDEDFYETQTYRSKKGEELYAFFRVLIRGRLTLLFYDDRYFVRDGNGKIYEISKKHTTVAHKIKTDYTGMGNLVSQVMDCPEMSGTSLEREYKKHRPAYVDLIRKYNQCTGSPYNESKNIRVPMHFSPTFQVSLTTTSLSFDNLLKAADFPNTYSMGIGLGTSIFLPKVSDKKRLVVEANYNRFNQYVFFFSGTATNNDLFVKYSCLKIPLIFRYSFTDHVFLDLGLNNQFILDQNQRWRIETMFNDTVDTRNGEATPFHTWTRGMLVGIGATINVSEHPLRLSLRYSQNHVKPSEQPDFRSIELGLSFQLVKPR